MSTSRKNTKKIKLQIGAEPRGIDVAALRSDQEDRRLVQAVRRKCARNEHTSARQEIQSTTGQNPGVFTQTGKDTPTTHIRKLSDDKYTGQRRVRNKTRDITKLHGDKHMDVPIVFHGKNIRRIWHEEEWWFSVADVIAILSESSDARNYWKVLKHRLNNDGSEVVTKCNQLKLLATDGKYYETDCANTELMFRIIQSIPSPRAEPFKLWLARVGYERVEEIRDPELTQERMKELYEQKGYSKSWIDKRLRGMAIRQDLTDEWRTRGVTAQKEFSILTAEITKATFGMTPNEYKNFKGLNDENLRDHMNDLELIFTMLGEASTIEIEKATDPQTFPEHKRASQEGGTIAKDARTALENKTKKKIVSNANYLEAPESKKHIAKKK